MPASADAVHVSDGRGPAATTGCEGRWERSRPQRPWPARRPPRRCARGPRRRRCSCACPSAGAEGACVDRSGDRRDTRSVAVDAVAVEAAAGVGAGAPHQRGPAAGGQAHRERARHAGRDGVQHGRDRPGLSRHRRAQDGAHRVGVAARAGGQGPGSWCASWRSRRRRRAAPGSGRRRCPEPTTSPAARCASSPGRPADARPARTRRARVRRRRWTRARQRAGRSRQRGAGPSESIETGQDPLRRRAMAACARITVERCVVRPRPPVTPGGRVG